MLLAFALGTVAFAAPAPEVHRRPPPDRSRVLVALSLLLLESLHRFRRDVPLPPIEAERSLEAAITAPTPDGALCTVEPLGQGGYPQKLRTTLPLLVVGFGLELLAHPSYREEGPVRQRLQQAEERHRPHAR